MLLLPHGLYPNKALLIYSNRWLPMHLKQEDKPAGDMMILRWFFIKLLYHWQLHLSREILKDEKVIPVYENVLTVHISFKCVCVCLFVCTHSSLSTSWAFLLARHCFTIITRVPPLLGVTRELNKSSRGVIRTRHRWSFGSYNTNQKRTKYDITSQTYSNIIYQVTCTNPFR